MSKLLIDDKPVMVLPKLAQVIGLNEAIVLQQIHYWLETYKEAKKSDHYRDGKWWVYNSKKEWVSNFPWWSESTIWRTLTALRESKVVKVTNYNRKGYDRTLWYTIDYAILSKWENLFSQNDKMGDVNLTSPIPKNISETNPETTSEEKIACGTQAPAPPDSEQIAQDTLPLETAPQISKSFKQELADIFADKPVTPATPDKPADTGPSGKKKNAIRARLEEYFAAKTGLPRPKTVTVAQKKAAGRLWWSPLREIADLVKWDAARAEKLIDLTVDHFRNSRLTISNPNSIVNTAVSIYTGNVPGVSMPKTKEERTKIVQIWNHITQQVETVEAIV